MCRVYDKPNQALFLLPDNKMVIRTFPGTFLNWDFAHSRAIIRAERLLRVVSTSQTEICSIKLPFVATRAWPFHDGTIMASSRGIGNENGPAWHIVVDDRGKVKGEAVFGDWMLFPDYYVQNSFFFTPPSLPTVTQSRTAQRHAHVVFVTIVDGKLISRSIDLHDGMLGADAGVPASNSLQEYNCFDNQQRLYTLMDDSPPPGKENQDASQTVYLYDHAAIPLVNCSAVAKIVGVPTVMLSSMTISPDGERLALTVTPDGEGAWRQWWLVEYRIIHPHGILP